MEYHPKFVILSTFVVEYFSNEIKHITIAIKLLINVFITEVTVVKDYIPSSKEEVLFESVITVSYSGKFDLL